MGLQVADKAEAGPQQRLIGDKGGILAGEEAHLVGGNVADLRLDGEVDDGRRLLAQIGIDRAVLFPGDVAVPGADVAPQEGKGRAGCRHFPAGSGIGITELALKQLILGCVGIEGDAG